MVRENKKIQKKIILIMSYTIFVLSLIYLCNFTTTHSKYKKDVDYAIIYQNQLYALNKGNLNVIYSENDSTSKEFHAFFTIEPNDIGIDNNNNWYRIEVPSGCSLSLANHTKNNVISNNSNNTLLRIKGNTQVNITCATDNPNIQQGYKYRIPATIYEYVTGENEFLYKNGYAMIESIPPAEVEVPDGKIIVDSNSEKSAYEQLCEGLKNYIAKKYGSQPFLQVELTNAVINYVDIYRDNQFDKKLFGMSVESDNGNYIFTIQENLEGYAYTKYSFETYGDRVMYFYTEDSSTLNYAFRYYLEQYFYPIQDEPENVKNVQIIMDYIYSLIGSQDISSYILNGEPTIPGIDWSNQELLLEEEPDLLQLAKDYFHQPLTVSLTDSSEMFSNFENTMRNIRTYNPIYEEELSDAVIETILQDEKIKTAITKNSTDTSIAPESFSDYFLVYDESNQHYLAVQISSDGISNYFEIGVLDGLTKEMIEDIQFFNQENGVLDVTFQLKTSVSSGSPSVNDSPEIFEPEPTPSEEVIEDSSEEQNQEDQPLIEEQVGEVEEEVVPPEENKKPEENQDIPLEQPSDSENDDPSIEKLPSQPIEEPDTPSDDEEVTPPVEDFPDEEPPIENSPSVEVSMTEEELEKIKKIIQILDQYFKKNSIKEDGTLESYIVYRKENDLITVTYSITKES